MAEELKDRKDVPEELTWDLSRIYATEADMFADAEKAKQLSEEIAEGYQGKLDTPERIEECVSKYRTVRELMTLVGNYCDLALSVDYYDNHNQERMGRISRLGAEINSRLSFVSSEITQQPEEVIQAAIELSEHNKGYLKEILREKAHKLHPEAERVISALGQSIYSTPYEIYNSAKLADMKFGSFTAEGKEYPLGYSLFEDNYEYEPDTAVRREAFFAFSKKIREYENVTAAAYNANVQTDKVLATLRGYDSVFDYLLFGQKVDRKLYDRQIDLIMEKLAPHMRKYARLIRKVHHLDRMTYADLKLPVDPGYAPDVTIEGSKEYIEKGLAILGEDYVDMIRTAYRERWVDFAQNKGKSTGGFCASPYGKNSYILLSWNHKMSDVFTLAHELGHAGHFKACNQAQSIFDTDVSTYFIEAPSTMNELLMGHYLLKTSEDKRFRRWVLACMIGNTYYHNFVTHLLEAAYQREVYRRVDAGESVQAESLSGIMREVLEKFWGDAVELNEGAELTWMRQPHYYMGLYSYTYSAGLTVATQVCKRIEKEGQTAVDDWKKVLAAGSTLDPVGLAALAGVDITTDAPLADTIETIGEMIDEICELTEELEPINPITRLDYPDVDVIRVEDTYYMISTTMHFMPGCEILRSYDLRHWEHATYVYDVLDGTPAQKLEGDQSIYGQGMWAASLRYHNGKFYVCFVANDTHKTYLYTSETMEGPWEKHYVEGFYHDCSLLFDDDDRVYIAYGNKNVYITELKSDLSGPKEGGLHRLAVSDEGNPNLGYEGTHFYKIGGRYYLFFIHSAWDHWERTQVCFVADSIDGEFVGGEILEDDRGYCGQGVAQGGIVDTPDGKWYAMLFQDSGAVGRIPILIPMEWREGLTVRREALPGEQAERRIEAPFPVLGENGRIPEPFAIESTRPGYEYMPLVDSDDFKGQWKMCWQFNHQPLLSLIEQDREKGLFSVRTDKLCTRLTQARNMITQRMWYPGCAGEVTVDGSALKEGDFAGICALQGCYGFIGLMRKDGQLRLTVRAVEPQTSSVMPLRPEENAEKELACIPFGGEKVRLRLEVDFTEMKDTASFYYIEEDGTRKKLGGDHKLYFKLDHFCGCRFGLFVYSTQEAGGSASFSSFTYECH